MPLIVTTPFIQSSFEQEILADNPFAWWRLDEPSGSALIDSSPTARTGSYVGSPTLNQAPLINSGSSVLFNGSTQYGTVTKTGSGEFDKSTFTAEAWIYVTDLSINRIIYHTGDLTVTFAGHWWSIDTTGKIRFEVKSGLSFRLAITTLSYISINTPYHVAIKCSESTDVKFYVNGALKQTFGFPFTYSSGDTAPVKIGAVKQTSLTNHWAGRLDEVVFFDSLLDDSRILAHYQAGI